MHSANVSDNLTYSCPAEIEVPPHIGQSSLLCADISGVKAKVTQKHSLNNDEESSGDVPEIFSKVWQISVGRVFSSFNNSFIIAFDGNWVSPGEAIAPRGRHSNDNREIDSIVSRTTYDSYNRLNIYIYNTIDRKYP